MRFSRYVSWISFIHSGDEGIRTPDPLLARQVLSQLSYTPIGVLLIHFSVSMGLSGPFLCLRIT